MRDNENRRLHCCQVILIEPLKYRGEFSLIYTFSQFINQWHPCRQWWWWTM